MEIQNITIRENYYKTALAEAESRLTALRNQTGGDEVARARAIAKQKRVVAGLCRLARNAEKLAA